MASHVWKHFQEDRCFEEAASLGYTSLLAMVPLLAVAFGIIAAFPVFNQWSGELQSFIFTNFLPATGEQIVPYIDTFLGSVSSLTLPGTDHADRDGDAVDGAHRGCVQPHLAGRPQQDPGQPYRDVLGRADAGPDADRCCGRVERAESSGSLGMEGGVPPASLPDRNILADLGGFRAGFRAGAASQCTDQACA